MSRRVAVMYVHGVESAGEQYAATAMDLLRSEFTRIAGVDADDALTIRPAFWAPVLEERQNQLTHRLGGDRANWLFDGLDSLAGMAGRGSTSALLAAAVTAVVRAVPGAPDFHFPTLRWLLVHYLGDAVAYQAGAVDRTIYDAVHAVLARTLHRLAVEAGDEAPVAVIAHSLGTVVAGDFLWDLQAAQGLHPTRAGQPCLSDPVAAELHDTPVERGETLAWLYTLGSPLALWSQRHPDFGEPVSVPHPELARTSPEVEGEWVNVWDPDDIVASPLKGLNDAYGRMVAEDRRVAVGPWPIGMSPLSHPYYWNDRAVVTPIATALARAWHRMNASG